MTTTTALLLWIEVLVLLACRIEAFDVPGSGHNCELSLRESEGFFCQHDKSWIERREVARRQFARNCLNGHENHYGYFQANWEPEFHCMFMERMGVVGDGGKWVCDPMRISAQNHAPCLVYSIGSMNNFAFENAVLQQFPTCEVHTFDHTSNPPGPGNNQAINFHKIGLAGKDAPPLSSLTSIFTSLNHTGKEISLFKIDIEGAEYGVFDELFKYSPQVFRQMRQILIEVHFPENPIAGYTTKHGCIDALMNNLHNAGFAIFSKEANILWDARGFEFSLIRLSPSVFQKNDAVKP
ncbi:methyltransferase domain-containing protein [Haematococcus lacustris]